MAPKAGITSALQARRLDGTKVLIGPSSFADLDHTPRSRLLEAGCQVVDNPFKRKLARSELMDLLKQGITGLVAGLESLDREVLARSNLKVISRCGSGLSNVDLVAAKELGIAVFSTPDGPTEAVAELTLGAMLSVLRMVPQMDADLHAGRWAKRIGSQLEGKTVAIIGFGRIGRRVASLLSPFRVSILAVDPHLPTTDGLLPLVPLSEALPRADLITLHCSGDACVLGESEFELVKPGVVVLNAARGGLIDERALAHALDANKVAGAWLDVFEAEPYSGPLTMYPQVILTPHVGSYTRECRARMELEAVDNLIAGLCGKG